MSTENKFISIRAFARQVGVDESTVRGHITHNKFTNGVQFDDKGRKKMKMPDALNEWTAFGGGLEKDSKRQPANAPTAPQSNPPARPVQVVGVEPDDLPDINVSKQRTEYYKAQTAQVEFEKLQGSLMLKADVYAALFEYATELRAAILSVPKLVVDDVMSCDDRGEAVEIIYKALESQLEKFAANGVLDSPAEKKEAVN